MAQYIKTEEGYKEFSIVTNDKMDKTDPTGTGSFSMNRKVGTVIGVNSHAEGNNTTASGDSSHAEGSDTTASDYYSHAEGYQTAAINNYSHAEGGNTTASGNSSHAEGTKTTASGSCSHAEGSETVANGTDSHAEGYKTTASGYSSHVEGYWATASGDYSHAEGGSTKASGNYSHTEGNGTRASGSCSHAEGGSTNQFASVVTTTNPTIDSIITAWKTKKFSVANGYYSHVEGKDNLALNDCSHAEGYLTIASGENSHAQGNNTIAGGTYSHAEGYHTIANGTNSHVQGKYNIEDTSSIYADIIGNGTSDTARSNAATVDWNGNAWFAGDAYTGSTSGTNKDDGSKKLATEEYVNSSIAATSVLYTAQSLTDEQKVQARANIGAGTPYTLLQATAEAIGGVKADSAEAADTQPVRIGTDGKLYTAAAGTDISLGLTSASVGQIIKVKAVDEDGKPTEWEAADLESGEEEFELIRAIIITESTDAISISTDENGNSFSLKGVFIYCSDSIGKGLDYKSISYSDSNRITLSIPNALQESRVTKIKAENDGGIYSLYGGWANFDKGTINRYEVVTDSPFTPITSIKITFGAAVSQGSVKVWGKK